MSVQVGQAKNYEFTEKTLLLIEWYEKKINSLNRVKVSRPRLDNRIRWVNELISSYDMNEADYNMKTRLENSHKDYKTVCLILDTGKLPDDVKRTINPKKYRKIKRCNVKQIARTIHLLKAAKRMGKNAFEKFICIPDINYILRIIERDTFGDLKYLNYVAA